METLMQKSLRASFRQGFWAGIQVLRFLDPGWKHAGVTEFETFARGSGVFGYYDIVRCRTMM